MGRGPRITEPGGIYHLTSRGNNGEPLVRDDIDRVTWLAMLARTVEIFGWRPFTYCLMTNHYHLAVTLSNGGDELSRAMQWLNTRYAQYANDRHGRTGHLFRNRFFSVALESEAHLLETSRYVVLNPVRAGMCKAPEEWAWSSYRACAGLEHPPRFLDLRGTLELFAPAPQEAFRLYRKFVSDGRVRAGHVRCPRPVSDTVRRPLVSRPARGG
jgi:REP element-mobilizing transposase RayT